MDDNPTIQSEPSTKRLKVDSSASKESEDGSGSESDNASDQHEPRQSVQSESKEAPLANHQDTSPNRPKTSSSSDNEKDIQEKMVLFLTGKPSSARSRYAKAFKFPSKVRVF
jgi:hypothetical protein